MYKHQDALLAATADAEARHFWYRGFRQFVTPLLQRATAGRTAPRILDCGCGTGHNVAMLSAYGWAAGFDYTRSGLLAGRRLGRSRLLQASAAAIPFPADSFDLVASFDMLQVLPDGVERAAIGEMRRVLKPGGALVVNVAAMRVLHGHHSLLSEEARRYSRRELRAALEGNGFEVDVLTHTNVTLFPIMLVRRTAQRIAGARPAVNDIAVPAAPINAALGSLLSVEARVLRYVSMPIGSSILCLAWKK